jgi:hypothetical protein
MSSWPIFSRPTGPRPRDRTPPPALQRVAFIDADGWFELRNLRDTPYDLELLDFDGRFEPARLADVRPGDAEVELAVRARP